MDGNFSEHVPVIRTTDEEGNSIIPRPPSAVGSGILQIGGSIGRPSVTGSRDQASSKGSSHMSDKQWAKLKV
jgi:hypothetical protein